MRPRALLVVPAVLLLAARDAHAHLMNSGFGPFYDGLAHPLVTVDDLLPVLALGLLAGLRGARCGRWTLFALPLSWAAGMAMASALTGPAVPGWWTGAVTLVLGAMVAADRPWPSALVVALAGVAGAMQGLGNGRELASVAGGALAMAGIVCAIFVLLALLSGQVASLRAGWARIGVRVAGSWIAAIGLLMLGWAIR